MRDIAKDKEMCEQYKGITIFAEIGLYWIAQYEELKSSHDIVQQFYDNLCIRSNEVTERLSARISELEALLHPNNRPDVISRPSHDRALETIFGKWDWLR